MGDILVPYDGSETARKALNKAADLVKEGESVVVVHVIPTATEFISLDPGMPMKKAQDMVNSALDGVKARGISISSKVLYGDIVDEILKAASEFKCSLIVIGSTGKSTEKIGRFLLGSVADKVARHASCPVLIVR
jgi:nucleotide-binding universal stress UspA family protein